MCDVLDIVGRLGSDGTENAIDLSEEERHLLGIWKELGVGANGNLSLTELHQVCRFLNMGHMTNKVRRSTSLLSIACRLLCLPQTVTKRYLSLCSELKASLGVLSTEQCSVWEESMLKDELVTLCFL